MPPQPHRPRELQWQIFRGSTAVQHGLLSTDQLRGKAWVRVRHDVYADARLERDHELHCRAAMLRLPPHVVLAGPSAAYLEGVRHAAGPDDDVHVIAPPGVVMFALRGLRVHHSELSSNDYFASAVGPRTAPARTAWDLASWLDPARAFDLADGGAQSPAESQLRVRLVLAGLPRPVAQHPVRLASGRILHPDLAWPQFKVAVEYDGQWHAEVDQLHLDRQRLNALVSAGWIVLHVTSRRLARDFPGIAREVRAALASRGWRP